MLRLLLLSAIISKNVLLFINHTQVPHIRAKIYSYFSICPLIFIVFFRNMVQIWRLYFYFLLKPAVTNPKRTD